MAEADMQSRRDCEDLALKCKTWYMPLISPVEDMLDMYRHDPTSQLEE
jgi:hypothetical protein